MEKILFDERLAQIVKARAEQMQAFQRAHNAWLEGVLQATAIAAGLPETAQVQLLDDLSGIAVVPAAAEELPAEGGAPKRPNIPAAK